MKALVRCGGPAVEGGEGGGGWGGGGGVLWGVRGGRGTRGEENTYIHPAIEWVVHEWVVHSLLAVGSGKETSAPHA